MTRNEILEMAKEAGGLFDHISFVERELYPVFCRFAELVAKRERQHCIDALLFLHTTADGRHNHYQYAANTLRDEK